MNKFEEWALKDENEDDRLAIQWIEKMTNGYVIHASLDQDRWEATDFLIYGKGRIRSCAARVRNMSSLKESSYMDEFTIRASLPSGVKTEYQKIMEGMVDVYFYAWKDYRKLIVRAFLLDMSIFRTIERDRVENGLQRSNYRNGDRTEFRAYPFKMFPNIIIDEVTPKYSSRGFEYPSGYLSDEY